MSPTLTTHDTRFDDPDPATIAKVLAALDGDRHVLATLGDSDLTYLQVSGGGQTGLALEFQDGSLDRHYKSAAANLSLEVVTDVFQCYARGDLSWREGVEWVHVPYEPQQTPWHSTWVGYIIILSIVIILVWLWRGW
jgi:hypothetical protein